MSYKIVIVRTNSDENLIFSAVRTWVQDTPCNVYIYGGEQSYGFKYAMLERSNNLVFTNKIESIDEDYLVLLRPGQYLTYALLSEGHSQIFAKADVDRIGLDVLLRSNLRSESSGPIMTLSTPNNMLNYHQYKNDWDVYTFLSKFNQVVIPNFPVFTKSIRVDSFADLPTLIVTLLNEPPMERVLVLPNPSPIDGLLSKIGYSISYDQQLTVETIITNKFIPGYKAVIIHGCAKIAPNLLEDYHYKFLSGWSIITHNSFKQRRIDLPGYFNEVDMLKFRVKELYDDFDLFIIGQMDTPYSSNNQIKQGYPEIDDPEGKVKLLTLQYPEEIKQLDNAWIKDKYYRQYSIYHPLISDYDLLFILDLDEIPNLNTIRSECQSYFGSIKRLEMEMHYYNLKWVKKNKWYHGYYGYVGEVRKHGADNIRVNPPVQYPIVKQGGWHISYFLTPELIKTKIESFAHQEFNKEPYINAVYIQNCIDNGLDLFGRSWENMSPADPSYVPKHYKMLNEVYWPAL
jgi:beta-1,4-mannosyl-glycoprotein beta-1,4-N-acetylglucosaminyltransferase